VPVASRYSLSDDFTVSPVYKKVKETMKTVAGKKVKKMVRTTVSRRWKKIITKADGKNANKIVKTPAVKDDGDKVLRTV
jgi:diphthamide biosynthesis methyltransferase